MQLIPQILSLALSLSLQPAQTAKISKVCFARGEAIYVKDMNSGVEKRVAKGSYPSLSPDGRMVAYSVDNIDVNKNTPASDMSRQIRVLDLSSGQVKSFDSLKPYLCYGTVWSPDSRKIVFQLFKGKQWQAAVMNVQSGEWRTVTDKINTSIGVSKNTWAADSESILSQDLDHIYQVSLSGDVIQTLAVSDIVDDISYVSSLTTFVLAPDGKSIIFDTDEIPDDKRHAMIWVYDLQSKARKRISPRTLVAEDPIVLPSGDEIVFTGRTLARGSRPGIYRMWKDGTHLQLIVANAEQGSVALAGSMGGD